MCARNDLILTNTKFNHKLAHRTTWQAPERESAMHHDGNPKRNPTRNQIDYVIVRKVNIKQVKDSRSHSSMITKTDHRIVITDMENIPIKSRRKNNRKKRNMI